MSTSEAFARRSFSDKLKNIFEVSHIRTQKLLEIAQGGLTQIFLSFLFGYYIDKKIIPHYDENESIEMSTIWFILTSILIYLYIYYSEKISMLVPFLFHYTDDYIPSRDAEVSFGGAIGQGIVLFEVMSNYAERLQVVIKHFNKKMDGKKTTDSEEESEEESEEAKEGKRKLKYINFIRRI